LSGIKFDTRKMVKDFGGVSATSRQLKATGYVITPDGVDKWRRRNNVPFKAILHLCTTARRNNKRFELLDYVLFDQDLRG